MIVVIDEVKRLPALIVIEDHQNLHGRNRLHRATTMDDLTSADHDQHKDNEAEPDMTQEMNAITYVYKRIIRTKQKHNLLQTQFPTFKRQN